jgi:hypothetical protein
MLNGFVLHFAFLIKMIVVTPFTLKNSGAIELFHRSPGLKWIDRRPAADGDRNQKMAVKLSPLD